MLINVLLYPACLVLLLGGGRTNQCVRKGIVLFFPVRRCCSKSVTNRLQCHDIYHDDVSRLVNNNGSVDATTRSHVPSENILPFLWALLCLARKPRPQPNIRSRTITGDGQLFINTAAAARELQRTGWVWVD